MAWEWIVLAALTIVGPVMFHRFMPVNLEITVRGGGVFAVRFGPVAQVLRVILKFGLIWLMAFGLAQLESRLWLRLWVLVPAVVGFTFHGIYVRKSHVHWLSGRALPRPL